MEKPDRFPDVMLMVAAAGPGAMLPLAGRPLIEWKMHAGRAEGATRFVASVPEPADTVLAHFAGLIKVDKQQGPSELGHIRAALPMLVSDPFFISGVDMVWPPEADKPLSRMRRRHAETGGIVLLCLQPGRTTGARRSHDFCLDPSGRITRDYGAPVLFGGVALLDRAVLSGAPENLSSLDDLFTWTLEQERLFGVVLDGPAFDLGNAGGLAAAEQALAR